MTITTATRTSQIAVARKRWRTQAPPSRYSAPLTDDFPAAPSAEAVAQAAAIAPAVRRARAMIVIIGLVPEAVGKALASPIHTPGVS
jgi:hypothetical protein